MSRLSRATLAFSSVLLVVAAHGSRSAAQQPLFTFVQISDSQPQSSEENQRFVDVLRTLAEAGQPGALLPRPVDLVLFAGDITWGNTRSEWTAAMLKLDTWLTANDIPLLAVPGNHDTDNSDTSLYEEFVGPSGVWDAGSTAFTGQNGKSRTTNWRGLRFIGFNNSNPGWNTIRSADLADIAARVSTASAAQENVFLLCHHPHDDKDRMPLVDVLPDPSAVGYLHGHIGTPSIHRGLAGIVNPNIWDVNTNAIYRDRPIVYFEVFLTELRAHVVILDLNPTTLPAPVVIPLVHPLTPASEPSLGFADAVHANARATPTSRSPERKLWFHDQRWWGILWSDSAAAWRIHRLDLATQTWVDGGTTVSTTAGRSFDALSEGAQLVVASNVTTTPGQAASGSPGQLHRFQYDLAQHRYTAEAGFPATLNDSRSPTLVLARDTTGMLWSAWTRGGSAFVDHTQGSDAAWAVPITLATGLGSADTVALCAFGAKVGALWSNANTGTVHFAVHVDGAPDEAWTSELVTNQAALVGSALDLAAADGRALAAVRGTGGALSLFARNAPGSWALHPLGESADGLGDPLMVVDRHFDLLRLLATGPTPAGQSLGGGGALYTKVAPLSLLDFPHGRGTPVLLDGAHPSLGFASSTRQDLDSLSGLVALASVSQTERYWHARDTFATRPTAPAAEFSATPRTGPAPLLVDFTDLSTGTPTWWSWDFGDGTSSLEQEPQHVYAQAGLYTVTLRAANGGGENVRTRTAYVDVGAPSPVQTFTPVADSRVYESSASSNYGNDPALRVKTQAGSSYQTFLRFDVGPLTGALASAKLRLFCTDASTGAGSVYRLASNTWGETTVTWNNRPALTGSPLVTVGGVSLGSWAEFELGPTAVTGGIVNLAVAGGTTNSVYYSSREGANPPQLVLTYAGAGTPPVAAFTGTPLSGPAPLGVSFTDASTGAPSTWTWDFGDGSSSTARNPTHVYTTPGTYTVILDVENASGLGSLTRLDYVVVSTPPPVRTFVPVADARVSESSVSQNYGTEGALRVKTQSGSSQQSFLRFDLTSLSGSVVSARLRLYCTDPGTSGGRVSAAPTSWTESGVTWSNRPTPDATLATLGAVVVGTWYELDVTSAVTGPGPVAFALTGGNTNTVYFSSREGTNPPQLVVETGGGGGGPLPPVAAFSANPLTGGAPLLVSFSDASTGATSWGWSFGDGSGSIERNPAHLYTAPGSYTVTLVATNGAGSDTLVRTNLVTVDASAPVRTFFPVADARTNESSPTSNKGADPVLRIRQEADGSYHSYLRFDLSSLTGTVTSAKLRLFSSDGSDVAGLVYRTSGAWAESTVTWSNEPGPTGPLITSGGTVATGAWFEFDVTSALGAAGQLDLVLQSTSSNSCYYSSREGTNPPELVVTTTP
jgi:PKD repeat protein/predicted MPP superfamily phosphohydrolase